MHNGGHVGSILRELTEKQKNCMQYRIDMYNIYYVYGTYFWCCADVNISSCGLWLLNSFVPMRN